MMTAIEALARSIERRDDPADFTASLETILNPIELGWVRSKSADELLAEFGPFRAAYPALATPEARMFVDAVLSELRAAPEDDSASS